MEKLKKKTSKQRLGSQKYIAEGNTLYERDYFVPDPAFQIKLFLLAYRGCIEKGFYRKRESRHVTQQRLKWVWRASHEPCWCVV